MRGAGQQGRSGEGCDRRRGARFAGALPRRLRLGGPAPALPGGPILRTPLLVGPLFLAPLFLAPSALASAPGAPAAIDSIRGLMLDATGVFGVSTVIALSVFAATTAVLHVRERGRWQRREKDLAAALDEATARAEQAAVFGSTEDQVLVTWSAPTGEAKVDGMADFLLQNGVRQSPLAFGAWASPEQIKQIADAVDALKARGEPFDLGIATRSGGFVEARGRAVSGRAVLHVKDVSATRRALLQAVRERDAASLQAGRLAALLDATPSPSWVRDPDGALLWVNRAYAAAVEAPSGDAVTAGQLELMDREERDRAAAARARGEAFSARAPAVMGGKRAMLDLMETQADGAVIGRAVDVSEIEALKADLRRQIESHVRLLDRLPTAVAVFDSGQRLSYRNVAYERLWSLDPSYLDSSPGDGEIMDRLRAERRLPEMGGYRDWKTQWLKAYASIEAAEDWWYLPDGRTVHVTTSANPQGGVVHLFDDVTERVSLQSQVATLVRTQRETLDGLREGVAVFGSDGRLKLSNPSFARIWRLPTALLARAIHVDEVLKACLPVCEDPNSWEVLRGAIVGVVDRREEHAVRMARRDGSFIDCALAPLPDGSTLLTFADVTDNVNVEKALTERNAALETAARLRRDFVQHVSYALRSPLTAIIGFAQMMGEEIAGPLNPRQRDYARLILRSSGTLLAIINDILDLASIDNEEMQLEYAQADVAELVASAARGLEDQLKESGVTLNPVVEPGIGPVVCDVKLMRHALHKLMSNAVGFSERGQSVEVLARAEGGDIVFTVTDHGRGIPEALQPRVFERFETHTAGSRHRGIGLGLAIVKSFVALHGGQIELTSALGRGTTVNCRIPAAPPAQTAPPEPAGSGIAAA